MKLVAEIYGPHMTEILAQNMCGMRVLAKTLVKWKEFLDREREREGERERKLFAH